jgi:hypothetical protein
MEKYVNSETVEDVIRIQKVEIPGSHIHNYLVPKHGSRMVMSTYRIGNHVVYTYRYEPTYDIELKSETRKADPIYLINIGTANHDIYIYYNDKIDMECKSIKIYKKFGLVSSVDIDGDNYLTLNIIGWSMVPFILVGMWYLFKK